MSYLFEKQASYLYGFIEGDIILNGAEWTKWTIGTTNKPEEYQFVYEAESPAEAQRTVDFILSKRAMSLDSKSTPGSFIYILQK
jgi:hypothetical protein